MIDCALWHSDRKGINGNVYGSATSPESISFHTNSLYMGGFLKK